MNKASAPVALLLVAALAGCVATQYGHADYGAYESVEALAADATDVVEVTVLGAHDATLTSAPFEGTDPESNPYYGVDQSDRPTGEATSLDVTVFEVRVEQAFTGSESAGSALLVSQLRDDAGTVPLMIGDRYVLFLRSVDSAYPAGIVGGALGQYRVVEGRLIPDAVEGAVSLSRADLRALR